MARIEMNAAALKSLAVLGAKLGAAGRAPSADLLAEAKTLKKELAPSVSGITRNDCAYCATCGLCLMDGPLPDFEGLAVVGLVGVV